MRAPGLLCLAALSLPFAASADRIAVVRFAVEGTTPQVARELRAGFVGGLAAAGHEVIEGAPVDAIERATPGLRGCDTATCAARFAELTSASKVARGRIVADGANFDLTLELSDGSDGKIVATTHDRCDVCTVKEAADRVSAQALALCQRVPLAVAPVVPRPVEKPPAPITSTAPDLSAAATAPPSRPALTVGKWAASAAAAGFIVAGIVMLAADGRPTCDAPTGVSCPRLYATGVEGGVFLTIGIVVAAGAALLFWLDRPPKR